MFYRSSKRFTNSRTNYDKVDCSSTRVASVSFNKVAMQSDSNSQKNYRNRV